MHILRMLALVPVIVAVTACSLGDVIMGGGITASGRAVTKEFNLADFTSVEIGSAFQAEITRADSFRVSVTADDNLFDYIRVTKEGTALRIFMEPNTRFSVGPKTLTAKITLPVLDGLELSGASRGTVTGFKSERALNVEISGASTCTGAIDAGNIRMDVSGASIVDLQGSGADGVLVASGASKLNLPGFQFNSATVTLTGASQGTVSSKSKLDYDLSGASRLVYIGNPTVGTRQTSGASTATQQ